MTSEEAKLVLSAYRAGDNSPLIESALARARQDPDLAAWLADQQDFDQAMTRSLAEVSAPPHLKALILQGNPKKNARQTRTLSLRWSMAAALLLSGVVFTLVYSRPSPSMDDFRAAMVEDLWQDPGEHVDFNSSNIVEVREWLQSKGAAADFALPAAVKDMRIRGARIVNWSGEHVASLCLLGDSKHLHLFVVPRTMLESAPPEHLPEFERCNGWRTVAWSYGQNAYLLSGMDYLSFMKKTRRARQWNFSG